MEVSLHYTLINSLAIGNWFNFKLLSLLRSGTRNERSNPQNCWPSWQPALLRGVLAFRSYFINMLTKDTFVTLFSGTKFQSIRSFGLKMAEWPNIFLYYKSRYHMLLQAGCHQKQMNQGKSVLWDFKDYVWPCHTFILTSGHQKCVRKHTPIVVSHPVWQQP